MVPLVDRHEGKKQFSVGVGCRPVLPEKKEKKPSGIASKDPKKGKEWKTGKPLQTKAWGIYPKEKKKKGMSSLAAWERRGAG